MIGFVLCFGVICAAFVINGYIFNHKIKKVNARISQMNLPLVCLGPARAIASEIFCERAKEKIDSLRKGLDEQSNEVLDYVLATMIYSNYFRGLTHEKFEISFPAYQYEHEKRWLSEKSQLTKKYKIGQNCICPEVFYFHHGLRFADKKVLDYIRNKDFFDCGAFIGDSVLILKNYSPKMIYSYEFSKRNIDGFKNMMRANNIDSGYQVIRAVLGDKAEEIQINEAEYITPAQQVSVSENGESVRVTTIDEDSKKYGTNVGFIKMDVEGAGLKVVRGAINTIKKYRPVLSLAVYHNTEELFGIKPFLEQHLKDYVFEFKLQHFCLGDFNEMILFAYPKEVVE